MRQRTLFEKIVFFIAITLIGISVAIMVQSCEPLPYEQTETPISVIAEREWDSQGIEEQLREPLPEDKALIDTSFAGRYQGFGYFDYDLSEDVVYDTPVDSIGLNGMLFHGRNGIIRKAKKQPSTWFVFWSFEATYQGAEHTFIMMTRYGDWRTFTYMSIPNPSMQVDVRVYPGYQHVFVLNYDPNSTNPSQTAHSKVIVQGAYEGEVFNMDLQKAYKIEYTMNKGKDRVPIYSNGIAVDSTNVKQILITQYRDSMSAVDFGRLVTINISDVVNGTDNHDIDPSIDMDGNIYNVFYWSLQAKLFFDIEGYPETMKGTIHQRSRFEGITSFITGFGDLGGTSYELAGGDFPTYENSISTVPYE